MVAAAAAVLRALEGAADPGLFRSAVLSAFAWARLLSDTEVDQFIRELSESLQVSDSLENPAPAAHTIASWRQTAEIYADPDLARILRSATTGDGGSVPAPRL